MTLTIRSAKFTNEARTEALLDTVEHGVAVASEADTPQMWADLLKWGKAAPFEPGPAPAPVVPAQERLVAALIAEGIIPAAKVQAFRDRLKGS